MQQVDRILGSQGLGFVLERAAPVDIVQVVGHHQAQIGKSRVTGMERIGSGAVQLLGDQPEIFGATGFEHAHDHTVFLAHAPHDLPDRVELPQLAGDIALDALEFGLNRR